MYQVLTRMGQLSGGLHKVGRIRIMLSTMMITLKLVAIHIPLNTYNIIYFNQTNLIVDNIILITKCILIAATHPSVIAARGILFVSAIDGGQGGGARSRLYSISTDIGLPFVMSILDAFLKQQKYRKHNLKSTLYSFTQ